MHAILDPQQDGGVILLDRLYHFNPSIAPADGELALVVTPNGELKVAAVEGAKLSTREALMPLNGPGREAMRVRSRVSLVGAIVGSTPLADTAFPVPAEMAQAMSAAANTGPLLRERIRRAIVEAAKIGNRQAVIACAYGHSSGDLIAFSEELSVLKAEMIAAGYSMYAEDRSLVVTW